MRRKCVKREYMDFFLITDQQVGSKFFPFKNKVKKTIFANFWEKTARKENFLLK